MRHRLPAAYVTHTSAYPAAYPAAYAGLTECAVSRLKFTAGLAGRLEKAASPEPSCAIF
jgi:hypothetical protein